MILYHGSNVCIDEIDLSKCRPYKDFGKGFYLTDIKEQAIFMAQRTFDIYGGEMLKNGLAYKKLSLQFSFHTQNAIFMLHKKETVLYGQ